VEKGDLRKVFQGKKKWWRGLTHGRKGYTPVGLQRTGREQNRIDPFQTFGGGKFREKGSSATRKV